MTDEPEMVERVARALGDIYETYGQIGDLRTARPSRGLLEAMARAAIEAMRGEPSDDCLKAASEAFKIAWWGADNNSRRDAWRAMIDVALGGKKRG